MAHAINVIVVSCKSVLGQFCDFFLNNWHNWEITGTTFCWFHGIMESVELLGITRNY